MICIFMVFVSRQQLKGETHKMARKKCDECQKTEQTQGSIINCEVWTDDGKCLLLCDDCFFNEKYERCEGRINYARG